MSKMKIDMKQGVTWKGKKFGYVCGDGGGYFFTWEKTLDETIDSLEVDGVDGDGGLSENDVREFLREKIASKF